jgi:hypothetical protein
MEMAIDAYKSDTEYGQIVENAIQTMPEDMYNHISTDANALRALHKDVADGVYEKVMPEVVKLQTIYGKTEPTLQTYIKVSQAIAQQNQGAETQGQQPQVKQQQDADRIQKKKRASVSPSTPPAKKQKSLTLQELASLDDDEINKMFNEIMGRSGDEY